MRRGSDSAKQSEDYLREDHQGSSLTRRKSKAAKAIDEFDESEIKRAKSVNFLLSDKKKAKNREYHESDYDYGMSAMDSESGLAPKTHRQRSATLEEDFFRVLEREDDEASTPDNESRTASRLKLDNPQLNSTIQRYQSRIRRSGSLNSEHNESEIVFNEITLSVRILQDFLKDFQSLTTFFSHHRTKTRKAGYRSILLRNA